MDVIGIDISTIKPPNTLKKKVFKSNWNLMVDHAVGFKHSGFYESKNGMVEPTVQQLRQWKREQHRVLTIRCDNAGENKTLQKACDDRGLTISFEYTARNTPQQNSKVEKGFETLYGRGKAMLNGASVPEKEKYVLF